MQSEGRLKISTLFPTQEYLEYERLKYLSEYFDYSSFSPITISRINGRSILLHGHHRAALFSLISEYSGDEGYISFREIRNLPKPDLGYLDKKILDLSIHYSSWPHDIPLSSLLIRDRDVYAIFSGTSELIFTLPNLKN